MIKLEKRINAFIELGKVLSVGGPFPDYDNLIRKSNVTNPWFTPDNVHFALRALGKSLNEEKIRKWIKPYQEDIDKEFPVKTIGVVMAGNIPLVGFHDFLCVLMAGHKIQAKQSSDDNLLLPAIADLLFEIEPAFKEYIEFPEKQLHDFDAVIATGSSNTSRYFEYYFGKYPNIIRRNRSGVAVITGDETKGDLKKLGQDIFMYYGLGCRSISKVFVPEGYLFDGFFEAISDFKSLREHTKYLNNYEYYRSIYLINKDQHFDNGFLMIKNDEGYSSPPSVLYSEIYTDMDELQNKLTINRNQIQCIVSGGSVVKDSIPFGNAQKPELWDYADGVDTMAFLRGL